MGTMGVRTVQAIREQLEKIDCESTYHIGGSGGRYQCRYCLRESFSESQNGDAEHHGGCLVFALRDASNALNDELRHRLALQVTLDDWQKQIRRLQAEEQTLRAALADVTAMCQKAAGWPANDVQGMRYHALEAADRGSAALRPARP